MFTFTERGMNVYFSKLIQRNRRMSLVGWFKYMLDMDAVKFDMFQTYVFNKLDVTPYERWKSDFERMYDCATRLHSQDNVLAECKQDDEKDILLDVPCDNVESSRANVQVQKEEPAEQRKVAGIETHLKDETTKGFEPNTLAISIHAEGTVVGNGPTLSQLPFESVVQETVSLSLPFKSQHTSSPCRYPRVYQSMYITTSEAMQIAESYCKSTGYDLSNQLQQTRFLTTSEKQRFMVSLSKQRELFLEQEYSNALMWERFETEPNDPLNTAWIQELMDIFVIICKRYLYDIETTPRRVYKRQLATHLFAFQMKYYEIAKQIKLQKLHRAVEKKCLQTCTEEKLLAGLLLFFFINPQLVTKEICPNVLIRDIPRQDFDDIKGTCLESLWRDLSNHTDLPIFRTSDGASDSD